MRRPVVRLATDLSNLNDDTSDKSWNYPSDDVESADLDFDLIHGAAQKIDFHNASPFVKLSWLLCISRFNVVEDLGDEDELI